MAKGVDFDFEKGIFKSKLAKKDIAKLERISIIQVLDLKGNVALTFQKTTRAP
jgi:hypothetical protein